MSPEFFTVYSFIREIFVATARNWHLLTFLPLGPNRVEAYSEEHMGYRPSPLVLTVQICNIVKLGENRYISGTATTAYLLVFYIQ